MNCVLRQPQPIQLEGVASTTGLGAVRMLDHAEGHPDSDWGLIISKEPHETYSDFGNTKTVRLKLDGVNVEHLEKSSVLYYWSQGKYRSIETSD